MPQVAEFAKRLPDKFIASVGGSKIRPKRVNVPFVWELSDFTAELLKMGVHPILVLGGGGQARLAKMDMKQAGVHAQNDFDTVGIAITEENTRIVDSIMRARGVPTERIDASDVIRHHGVIFLYGGPPKGEVSILGGTTPGHTTDTVAVTVAIETGNTTVFNISNTKGVLPLSAGKPDYLRPPIEYLTWHQYRAMIPSHYEPAMSVPFDPVASEMAEEYGLSAILIGGRNGHSIFGNIGSALLGQPFTGTLIHP